MWLICTLHVRSSLVVAARWWRSPLCVFTCELANMTSRMFEPHSPPRQTDHERAKKKKPRSLSPPPSTSHFLHAADQPVAHPLLHLYPSLTPSRFHCLSSAFTPQSFFPVRMGMSFSLLTSPVPPDPLSPHCHPPLLQPNLGSLSVRGVTGVS